MRKIINKIILMGLLLNGYLYSNAQSITYKKIFTNVKTAAPVTQTVAVSNIGQIGHNFSWSLSSTSTPPFCNKWLQDNTIGVNKYDKYMLFFIEGSFDGVTYQQIGSTNFMLRYNDFGFVGGSNPYPIGKPAIQGKVSANGNFPYIRVGYYNYTDGGDNVFTYCALNASYSGTQSYQPYSGEGAANNGSDGMARTSFTIAAGGNNPIEAAINLLSTGNWYDMAYLYIYGLTLCSDTETQSVTVGPATAGGVFNIPILIIDTTPKGCVVWPYTGKAYGKIPSWNGLGIFTSTIDKVNGNIIYRLENAQ